MQRTRKVVLRDTDCAPLDFVTCTYSEIDFMKKRYALFKLGKEHAASFYYR